MSNLAIIPARGGSKRIPRKNIKLFLGKPIIAYSIQAALKSNLFDEVMVSTDDEEIAAISTKYGAKIPFYRSANNSDDFATTADVIHEVLDNYEGSNNLFKYCCCIYPTAPLITVEKLKEAYDKLVNNGFNSVFPVTSFSYPIQRSLEFQNEKIMMVWDKHLHSRSQDLKPRFHDAGQYYWLDIDAFRSERKLFSNNSGAIIMSELEVQDIDREIDWKLAELKYELMNRNEKKDSF
ncbi:pseudaminic acid cytidylyltransferase [Spongiivirga sp. MCCC 1A20706]|uniref:pseudaminic acid cytidylyltransferase n=1 Tax=Spongiivirga sp. MCCC 1A20706 TaxID=3160963 RepID=UPI00397766CF